jgi:hypothetical protein
MLGNLIWWRRALAVRPRRQVIGNAKGGMTLPPTIHAAQGSTKDGRGDKQERRILRRERECVRPHFAEVYKVVLSHNQWNIAFFKQK